MMPPIKSRMSFSGTAKTSPERSRSRAIVSIRKGRISKLWVRGEDGTVVINYDRGWDIRPATDEGKAILKEITKRFN